MRKLLMASVFALVPFVAFAAQPQVIAGDLNLASTGSLSSAGVSSRQSTMAGANVGGNGAVIVGTVSGNYTTIATQGTAQAGPFGSTTGAQTTQTNVGGTISGGLANNAKHQNGAGATGSTSGQQGSTDTGGSIAAATNMNLGGFVAVTPAPKQHRGGRPG